MSNIQLQGNSSGSGTTTLDGKVKAKLATPGVSDIREPAWGPYGN